MSAKRNADRMRRYYDNKQRGRCDRCFKRKARPNRTMCQPCATKHQAVYRQHIWKSKGLVFANGDYQQLLQQQGGGCAICGAYPKRVVKHSNEIRLHVDHDHKTFRVRGLLCGRCNRGLGMFDDSVTKMRNAIRYVTLRHDSAKVTAGQQENSRALAGLIVA